MPSNDGGTEFSCSQGGGEGGGDAHRLNKPGVACNTALVLSKAWCVVPPQRSPVFSTPAVDEGGGVVVVARVDGRVEGLSLQDGRMVRVEDVCVFVYMCV
jgi:hypothetical protein